MDKILATILQKIWKVWVDIRQATYKKATVIKFTKRKEDEFVRDRKIRRKICLTVNCWQKLFEIVSWYLQIY